MHTSHHHYQLVEQAITLLEKQLNSASEMSLNQLADSLGVSPSHLQRVFTEWAGISPKHFQQCMQSQHARQLMESGSNALHASLELGLSSTSVLHHLTVKFESMTPGEIKAQGMGITLTTGTANTPLGRMFVCNTARGINNLEFETEQLNFNEWQRALAECYPLATFNSCNKTAQLIAEQIFVGSKSDQRPIHIVLKGSPFQLQVWQALMHIPCGQFASYQEVANAIGKPNASRAVGSAVAKNSIALLIPCHRVIQSTGQLGQYRWSSTRKKALHAWEQGLIPNKTDID